MQTATDRLFTGYNDNCFSATTQINLC